MARAAKESSAWLGPLFGAPLRLRYDADQVDGLAGERDALWARVNAAGFLTDERRTVSVLLSGMTLGQREDIMSLLPIPEIQVKMTVSKEGDGDMEPVLAKFFANFFPKFYEVVETHDDAAKIGLRGLTVEEKTRLAPILDDLIGPSHSAGDLVRLWRRSPADANVQLSNGDQIRELLKAARERIRQRK